MEKKRILVLASGGKNPGEGGSGFEKLAEMFKFDAEVEIVAVASNYQKGGVKEKAKMMKIPFVHFPKPENGYSASDYQSLVEKYKADVVMLSGWLKLVVGLDPAKTINIHPGLLPLTAGKFGHYVHEAAIEAYNEELIRHTAVTMHIVTEEYDKGPKIFEYSIEILPTDTAETLAKRVNAIEHQWQWVVLRLFALGDIRYSSGVVLYSKKAKEILRFSIPA